MQREYKVQKGESLQDVVVKLYGSLEYQMKFLTDNNLLDIDISQPQLYSITDRLNIYFDQYIDNVLIGSFNWTYVKKSNILYSAQEQPFSSSLETNYDIDYWSCRVGDTTFTGGNSNIHSVFRAEWTRVGLSSYNLKITPYFEPFTVIYDDSILKSIVPTITPSQIQDESNLKKYKAQSQQSFFDISLITTGGLNNIIALAYQNDIDINTFDSKQTPSISYYIDSVENRIIYNFMQTLNFKPATAIQLETIVPPTPGIHIAFNESFSNSFN